MKKTRQKQKEIVVFPQQQDLKEKKNPKYFLLLDPFQHHQNIYYFHVKAF